MAIISVSKRPIPSRPIQVLVVETDPIMRAGLVTCLNRFDDLQVIDVETTEPDLEHLINPLATDARIDVVLLGLPLDDASGKPFGLMLCQQLKATYPTLPILLLISLQDLGLIAARQMNIEGCVPRGSSVINIATAIRQLAAGQTQWAPEVLAKLSNPPARPRPWVTLRERVRSSGLQQIEAAIAEMNTELRKAQLSPWAQLILTGRRRELKAARWLVQRLLPSPASNLDSRRKRSSNVGAGRSPIRSGTMVQSESITSLAAEDSTLKTLQSQLLDHIAAKLASELENLTSSPLELDIFRNEKKRELLYLILRQLEGLLDELRISQIQPEQLSSQCSNVLLDLWKSVLTDFLGRYYTLKMGDREVEVVPVLLQDEATIQAEILSKIPQVNALFSHLLFRASLTIDNVSYPVGTAVAFERAVQLLENLMIQMANAVVQPLLNRVADSEAVKQQFYDRRLLSTRDIERFRNDLSWRYRVERYLREPKAIFESQYYLFVLTDYGIRQLTIYAPRRPELESLSGVRFGMTLILEARDAIAPRVQSVVSLVGSGLVYVLTEVIGRGIGLIGRGIVKGIGNIWQESRRS
jgi:DNA-binding NarL/FixJ family response regulator